MDRLRIEGGRRLVGRVTVSGAKNAALPLMAAALLADRPLVLENVPDLADIRSMERLVAHLGAACRRDGGRLALAVPELATVHAPYDLVRRMRASILVLGPLLARAGRARVALPGGCAIGPRPIDLHLKGLEALGAEIALDAGDVVAAAPAGGLVGTRIVFPRVSVGATENLMMAATLARGTTLLENAAREPEVVDLGRALIAMGAKISGLGGDRIEIEGVDSLDGAVHRVMPDRIEAGSYAVAAAITAGDVVLEGARGDEMDALLAVLREAGATVEEHGAGALRVVRDADAPIRPVNLVTQPYPGFPTDMQAQLMALMTLADGASVITETIFENRFMHVLELVRMGADITVTGASATVRGVRRLVAAPVMATDLRASMSLVIAGLAAEGETVVNRLYHLDRGYERLEEKLAALGASVVRESV